MGTQANKLTLRYLRETNIVADVVERWIPQAKRRQDLFGFIDIVAIGERSIVAIQAYTCGHGRHLQRIMEDESTRAAAVAWLRAGGSIELWWWRRLRRRNRRVWKPRIIRVVMTGDELTCSANTDKSAVDGT